MVAHARRDARRARHRAGPRLKLAQREASLAMGIDLIEWTYDPLQALNAHLNFAKLGVVVEEYEENIYGESSSPLHRGSPTDRFVAEWRLERAARRAPDRKQRAPRWCATAVGRLGAAGQSLAAGRTMAGARPGRPLDSTTRRAAGRDPDRLRRAAARRSGAGAGVAPHHPRDLPALLRAPLPRRRLLSVARVGQRALSACRGRTLFVATFAERLDRRARELRSLVFARKQRRLFLNSWPSC